MEYRKLISFGKSSYVISLPKSWIKQNNLKKGDLIYLEESGSNLVINKSSDIDTEDNCEKIIYVDGKDSFSINRELCSSYIQNCHNIIFKGKEIKSRVKELQSITQSLIALEIMEQTPNSIVARDFLNMDTISVTELIRKMDIVTRTMFNEAQQIFSEDNYVNLNERDKDLNRLYFLLYRAVLYNLKNPLKALKIFKMTAVDLSKSQFIARDIESIADDVRRIARFARELRINREKQNQIQDFIKSLSDYYIEMMKAVYKNDSELVSALFQKQKIILDELEAMEKEIPTIKNYHKVIFRFRRVVNLIHNIGRVVHTVN